MPDAAENIGRITTPRQHLRIAYKDLCGVLDSSNNLSDQIKSKVMEASFHIETALALEAQGGEIGGRHYE